MHLGDLDRRRTDSQGIVSYALALAVGMAAQMSSRDRLTVLCSEALTAEARPLLASGSIAIVTCPASQSAITRIARDAVHVPRLAKSAAADIVHLPKGLLFNRRFFGGRKIVATVHDDLPVRYLRGEFTGPASRLKLRAVVSALRRALRDADLIMTDTDFSRAALSALDEGARSKIVVAGCASTLGRHIGQRDRHDEYVIFDSPFEHKQSTEALRFVLQYLSAERLSGWITVIGDGLAGHTPLASDARVRRVTKPLASSQLRGLLMRARLVVVSSRYEGFGLPAVEAWSLGTPAVVAASGAAREVLDGLPGLYDFGDFEDFSRSTSEVLGLQQPQLDEFAEVLARRHSWAHTSRIVLDAYHRLTAVSR